MFCINDKFMEHILQTGTILNSLVILPTNPIIIHILKVKKQYGSITRKVKWVIHFTRWFSLRVHVLSLYLYAFWSKNASWCQSHFRKNNSELEVSGLGFWVAGMSCKVEDRSKWVGSYRTWSQYVPETLYELHH